MLGVHSRRDALRWLLGGGLLLGGAATLKRVLLPARLSRRGRATLEALLDTVLPEGPLPGHRVTGVMPRLVAALEAERQKRRALVEGLALLEREARGEGAAAFAELDEERRARLFAACGEAAEGSLRRFFYRTVRDTAVRLHFSHPEVWRRVGLPHPPQPDGFPDYAEAPRG